MNTVSLWALFLGFLKIGATAFGGFMALIASVQNDVVRRKKLLSDEDMLDGVSLATMLPGPVAVNVVAYVGYRLRGGLGALVSAVAVILPSFLLILALSILYFSWGQIPAVTKLFLGFVPAVTAIVLSTAFGMARKTIKGPAEAVIAVTACGLLLGVGGFYITLALILGAGVAGWALFGRSGGQASTAAPSTPGSSSRLLGIDLSALAAVSLLGAQQASAAKLFLTFAGMSVFLFGGGFVFIPLIQEIVVSEHGWVTQQEFVDGIALGQITPGPILISATFIGYKVLGVAGAFIATVAIFAPPALLMVGATRFFSQIKGSAGIKAALRGVRAAVIGMIVAAAWVIAAGAAMHWLSAAIFACALVALLRFRVDVAWIIPAAGLTGLALY